MVDLVPGGASSLVMGRGLRPPGPYDFWFWTKALVGEIVSDLATALSTARVKANVAFAGG